MNAALIESMALVNTMRARIQQMGSRGETPDAWLALARQAEAVARIARSQLGDKTPAMPRQSRRDWKMPARLPVLA